jgi:GNAT superfamily N-acetyltransferase
VPPTDQTPDLTLRPAQSGDLAQVADVFISARRAAAPQMPPFVRPDDQVRAWVQAWDLTQYDVWVAERDSAVVGLARMKDDWLDDLYVDPRHQHVGIGTALLEVAKALRPGGFCLWVFESNAPARGFYRRRGLLELERTDGSANEERSPDVKMAWPGVPGWTRTR